MTSRFGGDFTGFAASAITTVVAHLGFYPRSRDKFSFETQQARVSSVKHLGFAFRKEAQGNHLTCCLRHGPKPRHERQQEPREAYLEAEQLLSLSPPGFTPPSVQHHPRSSSSGHGRVRHPVYHRAGHGALIRPSGPAILPAVVQRFERACRSGETSLLSASAPGQKRRLIRSPSMKTTRVTSEDPVDTFTIKHHNA